MIFLNVDRKNAPLFVVVVAALEIYRIPEWKNGGKKKQSKIKRITNVCVWYVRKKIKAIFIILSWKQKQFVLKL